LPLHSREKADLRKRFSTLRRQCGEA